jgi:hypothetical protein
VYTCSAKKKLKATPETIEGADDATCCVDITNTCADVDGDGTADDVYECASTSTIKTSVPTTACDTISCSDAECCEFITDTCGTGVTGTAATCLPTDGTTTGADYDACMQVCTNADGGACRAAESDDESPAEVAACWAVATASTTDADTVMACTYKAAVAKGPVACTAGNTEALDPQTPCGLVDGSRVCDAASCCRNGPAPAGTGGAARAGASALALLVATAALSWA